MCTYNSSCEKCTNIDINAYLVLLISIFCVFCFSLFSVVRSLLLSWIGRDYHRWQYAMDQWTDERQRLDKVSSISNFSYRRIDGGKIKLAWGIHTNHIAYTYLMMMMMIDTLYTWTKDKEWIVGRWNIFEFRLSIERCKTNKHNCIHYVVNIKRLPRI